uniref:Uncharacterized protein n=1 Tax=Ditylenchus dipsaci TaxID=166011 RepID=A0A915DUM8_9BILA
MREWAQSITHQLYGMVSSWQAVVVPCPLPTPPAMPFEFDEKKARRRRHLTNTFVDQSEHRRRQTGREKQGKEKLCPFTSLCLPSSWIAVLENSSFGSLI